MGVESDFGELFMGLARQLFMATMPRRRDFIARWSQPYANLQLSALEFYASLAELLREQRVSEVIILRKRYKEGGLVSAKREYLRVGFGRYSCDICAAPFGVNFFFSCWTWVMPRKITWRHMIGMCVTIFSLIYAVDTEHLPRFLAIGLGATLSKALVIPLVWVLFQIFRRLGIIQTLGQADEYLSGLTIIGPIIDLFRGPTHYEVDTAEMFHHMVQTCLMEQIEKVAEINGLEPLSDSEKAPVMRELIMK